MIVNDDSGHAVMHFTALASGGAFISDWGDLIGRQMLQVLGVKDDDAKWIRIPRGCIAGFARPIGDMFYGDEWEDEGVSRGEIPYFKNDRFFGDHSFGQESPCVSPLVGGINPDLEANHENNRILWTSDGAPKPSKYQQYDDNSLEDAYPAFLVRGTLTICDSC